ncbi:MAG: sulfotransferase domain-containing protein [Actinomycetota bacterium]
MGTHYKTIVCDSARWDGFAFRDGDIIISTPPKCGTTWTQTICALLIFQTPEFPQAVDLISPWLDQTLRPLDAVVAGLEAQTHRRFIKSHLPFDGLPDDERVTYICVGRDPRDVALSWDNHIGNLDLEAFVALRGAAVGNDDLPELMAKMKVPAESENERFWQWVDDDSPLPDTIAGLAFTVHHIGSFWRERERPNVVMAHYGDLKADLEGQMRRLAELLGTEVPEERWPELVKAATFEAMKRRAVEVGPNTTEPIWQDTNRFFHRGTSGQWVDLLSEDDLRRYENKVKRLASPELSEWLHQGPVRP